MSYETSQISQKEKNIEVNLKRNFYKDKNRKLNLPLYAIKRFISRLSIAKKIGYGYALAIGIAVVGTTAGLSIGDFYKKEAQEQLWLVDEQQDLLRNLEGAVVEVRSHPQRLLSVLGKSILFEYESSKFIGEVEKFNNHLSNTKKFIKRYPKNLAVDPTEFEQLLKGYEKTTELYTNLIQSLWEKIDPGNLKADEISTAKQTILVATSGESAIHIDFKFEQLTESLNKIIAASETEQAEANERLDKAEALRLKIIVGSMLLSVAIATVLAIVTSRAIAHPLESVTQVARRVTQESNFDLEASVTTEDEVGSLATSLNQLVQWIGEYTHELELTRQTLEQRVEERTQELTETLQELKHTQAQLIQTEKMSSLGQLVSGVAHEINNPVNFIYGNLNYANDYTRDLLNLINLYQKYHPTPHPIVGDHIEEIDLEFLADDLPKVLSSMKMGADRIRQIVLSLRNFSRLDEAEMKAVNIHEGIENTLLILNNRLQGIDPIKDYGNLPKIECYPAQLNQVFMYILTNAIDALESWGIRAEFPNANSFEGKPQIVIQTRVINSNTIRVAIRDNGCGIPAEIKDKLFDPFFTTKPVGKGTGLGLSICYQIVEKHRGKIEVNSEVWQGTEVAIDLPIKFYTSGANNDETT